MPAILTESLFIDHPADALQLKKTKALLKRLLPGIAKALFARCNSRLSTDLAFTNNFTVSLSTANKLAHTKNLKTPRSKWKRTSAEPNRFNWSESSDGYVDIERVRQED